MELEIVHVLHGHCRPLEAIDGRYKIRGRQKRKARTGGPFLRFSAFYFGTGSDAKFAWTNTQLLSFFTKTRVDFARPGSVFPSLPMLRPI